MKTLQDLVMDLENAFQDWQSDGRRPTFDDAIQDAHATFFEVAPTVDCPFEHRETWRLMVRASEEWGRYVDSDRYDVHQNPPRSFVDLRQAMFDAAKRPLPLRRRPPETPQMLRAQRVGDEQICRIWGFLHPNGSADFEMLRRELTDPGSVVNDSFVSPVQREEDRERALFNAERKRFAFGRTEAVAPAPSAAVPCPESPRELWEQGVDAQQAAKMLGLTPHEVEELYGDYARETAATGPYANWSDEQLRAEMISRGFAPRKNASRRSMLAALEQAGEPAEA